MANKHHKSSKNSNMIVTKHFPGKRSVDKIHSQVMDRSQVAINQEFETHTQQSRMRVMNNNQTDDIRIPDATNVSDFGLHVGLMGLHH